jgi:hypothetical protein
LGHKPIIPPALEEKLVEYLFINPSAWGLLKPSSYCDVGRFFTGYLNFELNCAGVYSK